VISNAHRKFFLIVVEKVLIQICRLSQQCNPMHSFVKITVPWTATSCGLMDYGRFVGTCYPNVFVHTSAMEKEAASSSGTLVQYLSTKLHNWKSRKSEMLVSIAVRSWSLVSVFYVENCEGFKLCPLTVEVIGNQK